MPDIPYWQGVYKKPQELAKKDCEAEQKAESLGWNFTRAKFSGRGLWGGSQNKSGQGLMDLGSRKSSEVNHAASGCCDKEGDMFAGAQSREVN